MALANMLATCWPCAWEVGTHRSRACEDGRGVWWRHSPAIDPANFERRRKQNDREKLRLKKELFVLQNELLRETECEKARPLMVHKMSGVEFELPGVHGLATRTLRSCCVACLYVLSQWSCHLLSARSFAGRGHRVATVSVVGVRRGVVACSGGFLSAQRSCPIRGCSCQASWRGVWVSGRFAGLCTLLVAVYNIFAL